MLNDNLLKYWQEPQDDIGLSARERHGGRDCRSHAPTRRIQAFAHFAGSRSCLARKEAQRHVYSLNAKPLEEIHHWLEPYRQFWTNKLDDLENCWMRMNLLKHPDVVLIGRSIFGDEKHPRRRVRNDVEAFG